MRIRWLVVTVVFGLVAARGAAAETVLWSDSFESHNFAGWLQTDPEWRLTRSAAAAHSGEWGADIQGATSEPGGAILSIQFSTLGYEALRWQCWSKVRDGLEGTDLVALEWSTGGEWQNLTTYANLVAGDWQYLDLALPLVADNNPALSLRLRANLSSSGDRMGFDDCALVGTLMPEPASALLLGAAGVFFRRRRG